MVDHLAHRPITPPSHGIRALSRTDVRLALLEIDRGGYGCHCHSPLMSATVDSFFDEYARRYTEGDIAATRKAM